MAERLQIVQMGIRSGKLATSTLGLRGFIADLMGLTRRMTISIYYRIQDILADKDVFFTGVHVRGAGRE
jgi:hypothetical protein